jgi:hypothetical protein
MIMYTSWMSSLILCKFRFNFKMKKSAMICIMTKIVVVLALQISLFPFIGFGLN